ncbi:CAP domain-containing protein [Massilia niastensis]|uniref:CAP domain-containing protein n=1 Tax=Massilia niastensis TaxID=544911 RepID=UPI000372D3F1|nr:CAP domain-containing protein [Massilia niastensis]
MTGSTILNLPLRGLRAHTAVLAALPAALLFPGSAGALPAPGDGAARLTALVNAYRAAPGSCAGRPAAPVAALQAHPALASVRIGPATFIENALERAGYAAEQAEAISVTGPEDAAAAMHVMQQKYCRTLLSTRFAAIGTVRSGNEWTVVLARPAPPLPSSTYPDWRDAGRAVLEGVNAARASARHCGSQHFPPAPPVRWNPSLGEAALGHSRDMAARRYFSHQARDGSMAAERVQRAGYLWGRVGENIAFGPHSPEEAVAGWLDSPGHCANIMNPGFTEMGAAYGVAAGQRPGIIYWTQVFARPR